MASKTKDSVLSIFMPRAGQHWMIAALIFVVWSSMGIAALAQNEGGDSKASDEHEHERRRQIEFRQKKAKASMEELEVRMFQLSELIRKLEPDHAARLVLGLQKSREELIVDEMQSISRFVKEGKFDEAEEMQRRVIFRLNELRDLLLSTDLDLLLKLQRLRKLNKALKNVEKIQSEQDRLAKAAAELAKKEELDAADKKKLKKLARSQKDNRKRSDLLQSDLNDIADAEMKSPKALKNASEEMKKAEKKLKGGDANEAEEKGSQAKKKVDEAEKDMSEARKRLLQELQPFIRKAIIETLLAMIEKQQIIDEELAHRSGKLKAKPGRKRRALSDKAMTDGAREIQTLAKNALQLLEETEYAAALPWALRYIQEWAEPNVGAFMKGSFGLAELRRGKKIEKDAKELVSILVEEDRFAKQNEDKPKALEVIKLLAELRTLRLLQDRIHADTTLADKGQLSGLSPEEQQILRKVQGIRDWEVVIQNITKEIEKRGGTEHLRGDNEEGIEDDEFF
ncbi:MAG: hypothetical protein V3W41_08265 [Planctomycetota bacterium]